MDTIQIYAKVNRRDISYIQGIVEAYDGLAIMRTFDPKRGIIEVMASPYFEKEIRDLLAALGKEVDIEIIESPFCDDQGSSGK